MPTPTRIEVPDEFICPITHEMMIDPLVSRFGAVYERSAILEWIAHHDNACPLTRKPLRSSDLVSHHALRLRIQLWCQASEVPFGGRSVFAANDDFVIRADDVLLCARVDLLTQKKANKGPYSIVGERKRRYMFPANRLKDILGRA